MRPHNCARHIRDCVAARSHARCTAGLTLDNAKRALHSRDNRWRARVKRALGAGAAPARCIVQNATLVML
eukprot:11188122-Lingulodinium_polyedra.AAC.1